MASLVSPFESDMLALTGWEMEPINPRTQFRHPVPSGNSLNQDVVFSIPATPGPEPHDLADPVLQLPERDPAQCDCS